MNASTPSFGMAVKITPEANAAIKKLPGEQVKRILKRFTYLHNESNKVDCDAFISLKPIAKTDKKKGKAPAQIIITNIVSAIDSEIPGIQSAFKLKKIGGFFGGGLKSSVMNDISTQADKQADILQLAKFETT